MSEPWPDLPYPAWRETKDTLHMFTQVVGKVKLELCPFLNQWWEVAFGLTARGLGTGPIPHGEASFDVEFDFVAHRVVVRHSDGAERAVELRPRSVADFHAALMGALGELGVDVEINTLPSEVPDPIRFEEDEVHASYDGEHAARYWRILLGVSRVMERYRTPFHGKSSPVNFYWGGFDLSETRFTGRSIPPPAEGGRIMEYGEDEENFAVGFWPGADPFPHPILYAYMIPAPEGQERLSVQPAAARFEPGLGEFVLLYEDARAGGDPAAAIAAFFQSTYEACADLAGWDRAALEGHVPPDLGRRD